MNLSSVEVEEDIRMANSDNREVTISEIIAYKGDIYIEELICISM